MKNKILIILSSFLLLLAACKKEDPVSDSISGHVYEEGTGNPVAHADVFLIAQGSGIWAGAKVMAQTKADQNGAFTIKNTRHEEIVFHFLAAQASDYYDLNSTTDRDKYTIEPTTEQMNISLFRKANIQVRLVNTGQGENIEVQSSREVIKWLKNAIPDTTLILKVDGYLDNKIHYSALSGGVIVIGDTIVRVIPSNTDTLLFKY